MLILLRKKVLENNHVWKNVLLNTIDFLKVTRDKDSKYDYLQSHWIKYGFIDNSQLRQSSQIGGFEVFKNACELQIYKDRSSFDYLQTHLIFMLILL